MKQAVVGLFGAAMVVAAIIRYPPDPSLRFAPGLFVWPDGGKLAAVLLSLAALLALDLAAYAAGRALHRFLRPAPSPSPAPALAVVERLALGLVLLGYGTLGLAAVHALHRPLIVGTILVLAVAGAVVAALDLRVPAPSWSRRGLLLTAAGAILIVSPLLAAWLPDYGWDGFAYHLALPERYLFRNRIVVTPLFPHSAFPQTVEMLYLLALSLDSGTLAKLIHLQFGVFTAAAVFLVARRTSVRAGVLAIAILAADPLFNWELGVAYNDLAAAFFAVLTAAAFDEWRRGGAREALRLTGIFAGVCVSMRYTAAAVPVAVLGLLWLGRPWGAWRAKLGASIRIGGIAGLVLSPWLVRNFVMTGNPFAPAAQALFYTPGQEYFDPIALAQSIEFTRQVGTGRNAVDLILLPVNATLRVREGFYETFGYRVGVLYVVGILAWLLSRAWRTAPASSTAMKLAGLLTLLWFFTFQEPRYLLPALALMAAGGGVGLDLLIPRGRTRWGLLWLVPAAALAHTQWPAALLLPYRFGYALGGLPVAGFQAQEPALAVVPALRRMMAPGDRLFPIYENRGFFYRGLDYVTVNWPELMMMVHTSPTPRAFADRLAALGVTYVLVNPNNLSHYRTWFVEGYGPQEHDRSLALLSAFLAQHTTPVIEDRGVLVRRLKPATAAGGS